MMSLTTDQELIESLKERGATYLRHAEHPIGLSALDEIEPNQDCTRFDENVFRSLLEYLGSRDIITPAEEALRINELVPSLSAVEDQYGLAIDLWLILFDTALEIPYNHPFQNRLASLVGALRDVPISSAKQNFAVEGSPGFSLRDLPGLRYDLDHRLNEHPQGEQPASYSVLAEQTVADDESHDLVKLDEHQVDRWIRLQSFNARLVALGVRHTLQLAIWFLRESAIEEPVTNIQVLSCDITAASLWFIHAGVAIFQSIKTSDPSEYDTKALSGGPLYHGTPGFRRERWDFWKLRLQVLLKDHGPNLDANAVKVANEAIQCMSSIDNSA